MQKPDIGILEWFWINDRDYAEQVIEGLKALNVKHLRFGFSWADYLREDGPAWYDWLLPRLAAVCELLPCFLYTPPSLGEEPSSASPPRNPKDYADFIDLCIDRYGQYFDEIELWNEPNNFREWDATLDGTWQKFAAMVGGAAYWAHQRGKRTVLGGMMPLDPNWLHTLFRLGVMSHIDVVGIHGFPGSYDITQDSWQTRIGQVQAVLDAHGSPAKIWVTEVGYPTWRNDEFEQLRVFTDVLDLPVERVYWLGLKDLAAERPSIAGFHRDQRDYHFGLVTDQGREKLLFRRWASAGLEGVRAALEWERPVPRIRRGADTVLITGGAGFIGANLVDRLVREGRKVRIADNLSRPGVEHNLEWLRERHPGRFEFMAADLRDEFTVRAAVAGVSEIYHLAGQVAVTSSLSDPYYDFDVNLRGTLNLLEAARRQPVAPKVLFTSTNKVYGALPDIGLEAVGQRYLPTDAAMRRHGVAETRPLDFHSPYGCSKGGADQYVVDYARCMGVPAVVFRMSCIYGPRQFGTEDQGWVAHFLIRALRGEPITVYGDGKQIRDILFVEDLVEAMLLAGRHHDSLSGQAFNIGGGPGNAVSLLEVIDQIGKLQGACPALEFADWRPGDQRYYCSDTRKFQQATGWRPKVAAREGIGRLHAWLADSYVMAAAPPPPPCAAAG